MSYQIYGAKPGVTKKAKSPSGNPFKCKSCGHSLDVSPDVSGNCRIVNLLTGEVCGCKHK